jgi:hypothetical protein
MKAKRGRARELGMKQMEATKLENTVDGLGQ